jgi:hypothetical protein
MDKGTKCRCPGRKIVLIDRVIEDFVRSFQSENEQSIEETGPFSATKRDVLLITFFYFTLFQDNTNTRDTN